jgi:hypothetical protein
MKATQSRAARFDHVRNGCRHVSMLVQKFAFWLIADVQMVRFLDALDLGSNAASRGS